MDWKQRWVEKTTTWDLGGPHPLTSSLLSSAVSLSSKSISGKWLIPGCGRAHDAPALIHAGAIEVHGVDLSEIAVEEASRLYGRLPGVTFAAGDITKIPELATGRFSGVFDRAMMCALQGQERFAYLQAIHGCLMDGGIFVSIPFASVARPENGPPFQMSESEIRQAFSAGWQILLLRAARSSACDQKILGEWELIARKTAR